MKKIHWKENLAGLEDVSLKLNFKTAGAVFGKHVNDLKKYVENISSNEKETLIREGKLEVHLSDQSFKLDKTHVSTESHVKDGYTLAKEGTLKVLLCTQLTRELIDEGHIRDFIRCIQDNRKKLNYPIEKYIDLHILCTSECQELIVKFEKLIKASVLVQDIVFVSTIDSQPVVKYELDKNGLEFTMNLK